MSVLNNAISAVMDLIDGLNLFAPITRGALGTADGLTCEVAPSVPSEIYLDKNAYIPLTLALNGKQHDLQIVTDALNTIIDTLSRMTEYPSGTGWEIVDISAGNLPRIIGREPDNAWLVAGDLVIKIYRKDDNS